MPGDLYTPDEAAKYLGVSRATVYRLSDERKLLYYDLGGGLGRRYRGEDLRRFLFQDRARLHGALVVRFSTIHQELVAATEELRQVADDFGPGWETQVGTPAFWADVQKIALAQMEAHRDLSALRRPTLERLFDEAMRAAASVGHRMAPGVRSTDTAYARCEICEAEVTVGYPPDGGEIRVVVDQATQAPCPVLNVALSDMKANGEPTDVLDLVRSRRQAMRSGPAFQMTADEIVRRFRQWEQAATRSPNKRVAMSAPLDPPTIEQATMLLPRLRELREQVESRGADQHGRPAGNLEAAAMGWLWEEWRDSVLGPANGYRDVWTDTDDPLYGRPRDRSRDLAAVTPYEFEAIVSDLLRRMGYEVKLTTPSHDNGVDCVVVDPRSPVGGKVVVQAKWSQRPVGVGIVRELYGTMQSERANKGILITTSQYTSAVREFAKDLPLELIDGAGVLRLLEHEDELRSGDRAEASPEHRSER